MRAAQPGCSCWPCPSRLRSRRQAAQRYLYVALPGSDDADPDRSIRILVFDIANAHRFVRRIPLWPAGLGEDAEAVRGTAASARTGRFYVSTTRRLAAIDLNTDKVVWEQSYEGHCCERAGRLSRRTDDLRSGIRQPEMVCRSRADRRTARDDRRDRLAARDDVLARRRTCISGGLGLAAAVDQRRGQTSVVKNRRSIQRLVCVRSR